MAKMSDSDPDDTCSTQVPSANTTNVVDLDKFRKEAKEENEEQEKILGLSEEEIESLVDATTKNREEVVEEEEILGVIAWAQDVRFNYALLNLVLDGELSISWDAEYQDWKLMPIDEK